MILKILFLRKKLHIEVTQTEGQKAEEIHVVLFHNDESEERKEKA